MALKSTVLVNIPLTTKKFYLSKEKLNALCGRDYSIQKVAIIIGAFIENPQNDFSNYWILNENSFPKFFANAKENLSIEKVRSISNHVTEWIKVSVD